MLIHARDIAQVCVGLWAVGSTPPPRGTVLQSDP